MEKIPGFPCVPSLMPILEWEARRLSYNNSFTKEDLVQEGVIAVMGAIESYDPERGGVSGYLRICARNRMISYLRRNGREYPAEDELLCERLFSDGTEARYPDDADEMIERRDEALTLFSCLSPFETEVLVAYLKNGELAGTADMLRCEKKKVDNALQRIRVKARGIKCGEGAVS
jgi:RNA polymerase sigma factor (sigma-70 family)